MLALQAALDSTLRTQPVVALAVLFGAGVATSFTPCIFPMIPITAGLLGGAGVAQTRRRTVFLTLSYVIGLALVYALLGVVAGLTGSIFGAISSNPWAYFVAGNLLLVFALGFLDVFRFDVSPAVLAWASRFAARSYGGAFAMGATSGLVAAPCGAPAFAAVLTYVGLTRSASLGFLYLFVFALGMTAVLAVVGLTAGGMAALPKAGRWMVWVKRAGGVVLLAMAEYYFVQMGKVS